MTTPDWTNIGIIASTVALVMSGFLWLGSKIFNLGKTSQRLDSIETDLTTFKHDVNEQFQSARAELKEEIGSVRTELKSEIGSLNQRLDKLILTISQSQQPQTHPNHGHH